MKKYLLLIIATVAFFSCKAPIKEVETCPDTIVGKLENGMTYYIRANKEPEKRASFYIIQNVGAVLETDEQNGLAHFLEHMAFNGTKHFPEKGIIKSLEKHGIKFGANINAYTAQEETVYNVSSVPTDKDGLLDSCLLILHDWSHYLTLNEKEIDAERGVISEEWRTRRNSSFRLNAITTPVIFKGSIYAERDVIGDYDLINNFEYDTLRDFYHKWYRPDLQAIAVVGDFDAEEMEKKVIERFSSIPKPVNPAEREEFFIPDHKEDYFVVATDKEATQNVVQVLSVLPKSDIEKNSVEYFRSNIVMSFFNSMISARISEIMNQRTPPFLAAGINISGFVRNHDSYSYYAVANEADETTALKAILTEQVRIERHGFQDSELERVKEQMLAGLETNYKQRDKISNDTYISSIKSNFLYQTPLVDQESYYEFVKAVVPRITVEEVNEAFKKWNTKENISIVITGQDDVQHLTKEEIDGIYNVVYSSGDILPFEDELVGKDLLNAKKLKGSKIKTEKHLDLFDATEFELENKIKVVYKKADYEKDQVLLYAYSEGGTSLYDVKDLPNAENTSVFASTYGLGEYSNIDIRKIISGKVASSSVTMGHTSESVSGSSTPADIETMFQLMYMRFVQPRVDEDIFIKTKEQNYDIIKKNKDNPNVIMQDSIDLILSNYHPRKLRFTKEYLDQVDMDKMHKIYKERFANAADFTFFIVGNVEKEDLVPMIEKYIGSLPTNSEFEEWRDNGVRGPKGYTKKRIGIKFETPKSFVVNAFSKNMEYVLEDTYLNSVLADILDLRYTENIREKEGGTYGVSVNSSSSKEPEPLYSLTMTFDCEPSKAEYLSTLIYAEIKKIMKEGVSEEEINKVVSNYLKNREQSKKHNSYWLSIISTYYIHDINNNDPDNFENILNAITPEKIKDYTNRMFTGNDHIDVIFSPKE